MSRSVVLGLLALIVGLCADAPRKDEERKRDRDVLQAVLADVMDPKNPLNEDFLKNTGGPGKEIVVDLKTRCGRDDPDGVELEDLDHLVASEAIPKSLNADLRRRYRGPSVSTRDLGITDKRVVFEDIGAMVKRAGLDQGAFIGELNKAHPHNWGYVIPYLPGYAADGRSALVYLFAGPSPHGMTDTYLLDRADDGSWHVRQHWREMKK